MPILSKEPISGIGIGTTTKTPRFKVLGPCCCPCPACQSGECGFFDNAIKTLYSNAVQFQAAGFSDANVQPPIPAYQKFSKFNGLWRLCQDAFDPCQWSYCEINEFDTGRWFRVYLATSGVYSGQWILELTAMVENPFQCDSIFGCTVQYTLGAGKAFVPTGTNVFTNPVWDNQGECIGPPPSFPATLTVVKGEQAQFCGCCYPTVIPNTLVWSDTFPGGYFNPCTLTYDPADLKWKGSSTYSPDAFCPGDPYAIEFYCTGAAWEFRGDWGNLCEHTQFNTSSAKVQTSCSPFLVQNMQLGSAVAQVSQ